VPASDVCICCRTPSRDHWISEAAVDGSAAEGKGAMSEAID
jgi:hypothetical protein